MSLFPAYDPSTSKNDTSTVRIFDHSKPQESKPDVSDLSWLKNTSYSEVVKPTHAIKNNQKDEDAGILEPEHKKNHSKHKKKKKRVDKERTTRHKDVSSTTRKSSLVSSKILEDDNFYEDKMQEKGNLLVDTLYRPAIPKYDKHNPYFRVYKLMKKKVKNDKKTKRYYSVNEVKTEIPSGQNDETFSKEEELSKITEEFNKKLSENPRDIDTWLEYLRFQNTVLEFEETYRGNPSGGKRVMWERQAAILDRALQNNPGSDQLLTMKLQLLEHTSSPDQVADECLRALVQDPGCVPLWHALIRTCRNNMGRCVAPAVVQVFTKALSRLGQLRVYRPPGTVDRDILALLLESGLFLQQAGLWEQLMMLLQMYLGLNLTASGQFTLPLQPEEDTLREQEDSVLASGLPLSVLWLRIEKLRAAFHFLPLADCPADPQRVVFSEDLAGLLQPVIGGDLRLQLVSSVFLLLKVPVLPTRHTTLVCLGLPQIPSAINNIETLLAAAYPVGFSSLSNCQYLSGGAELVSEPQFVREAVGQAEFLSTIVTLLQRCAELLPPAEALVVHVWLLRFYTLLCRLHALQLGTVSASVVKQGRTHAKQLLKQPQYRENLLMYSEYAMMERAAGELERACKVLETAAALPQLSASQEPNVHRLLLCRRLVECLLIKNYTTNKDAAVKVLQSVQQGDSMWQQFTTSLVERSIASALQPLALSSALAPQLLVEWLTCHALYLALTRSVWDATALLQQYIDVLPHEDATMGGAWVEQLYEVLSGLLYLHTVHSKTGFATLRSTLLKALKAFPNNLTLLNTLACLETSGSGGGSPLWRLVSYFPSEPFARLVLVFVVRYRISLYTTEMSGSGGNYLRNLLRHLSTEEGTSQCPLMWRLYLQLVAAQDCGAPVKATFYKALQACPWVKALYLDAVKFLPEELPEVQDLLIEKELRLHTTPEELEILRE